jgi:hypothetical protein
MQGQPGRAMVAAMIRSLVFATLLGAAVSTASAQGAIDTVARGTYVCELPGDAGAGSAIAQPDLNFTIQTNSLYSSAKGGGTYLRRGDQVEMTSGPRRGEVYQVMFHGFLRRVGPDGKPGPLRCVLQEH